MRGLRGTGAVLGMLVACFGCGIIESRDPPAVSVGRIDGVVVGSGPVHQATIEVWAVDEAGARSQVPLYRARSDDQGRFEIAIDSLAPPFVVTARGGSTMEHWSPDDLPLDDQVHLQAVVTRWLPGQTGQIVISPYTTIAEALGARRLELGEEDTYAGAVARALSLLDAHFGVDLGHTFPAREIGLALTEDVRHALILIGLSGMVEDFARRSGRSILAMNVIMLTAALAADARADARLDGVGPAGAIALDRCMPACLLSANTLRSELARALLRDYIFSEHNRAGLDVEDVAELVQALAEDRARELFGTAPLGDIDSVPPAVEMLPSAIYDESQDLIAFDTSHHPAHVHDAAAVIDLSAQLGRRCPVVHKHTDLLGSIDDNPLRWRFVVRDDITGVRPEDVSVLIRPPMNAETPEPAAIFLDVAPLEIASDGSAEYEAVALRDPVAALARTEGTYWIEIRAKDRLGNEMEPLAGCWEHVPRAAPLWVGVPQAAIGPGSFDDTNLDNDEIAALLGGKVPPPLGKVLIRFDVDNRTDDAVYLTLDFESLEGSYERTWIEARALVEEDHSEDTCLVDAPPCSTALPREPRTEEHSGLQQLPQPGDTDVFLALRVIDKMGGFEEPCAACDAGEARLAPQRRYEVQVVATTLDFLVPADVDPGQIGKIEVGPVGSTIQLTGIVDEEDHVHCVKVHPFEGTGCIQHQRFQLYRALTRARIDIDAIRIHGRAAPAPWIEPRTPRPPTRSINATFAAGVLASYRWTAEESTLPSE